MARGQYRTKLPRFRSMELAMIGGAVDELGSRLEEATEQRAALTRRLIEIRDDERRALARELHDEFGQNLSAILAFANTIETASTKDNKDDGIAQDARMISQATHHLMASLRDALKRLRNPLPEELGLEASLVNLVDSWRSQSAARPTIQLDLRGDLTDISGPAATTAYRVAQECLTNALRHGAAREISLARRAARGRRRCVADPCRGRRRRRCGTRGAVGRLRPHRHPRARRSGRRIALDPACARRPQRRRHHPARRVRPTMSDVAATGISVLLVDDHPIVRQGYRRVLESQGDLHVVAEADNAADAYGAFKAHDPDVVVLDISMPGASGLEAIRNIRARSPRARILVFTMHNEAVLVKAAFSAGASGFVTKSSEPSAVVTAIRSVARGERAMSDDIAHILAEDSLSAGSALDQLGEREIEILRQFAGGATTEQIAAHLNLSVKTVQNYHYLIKTKTGARTDAQLVRLAASCGLTRI